MSDRPSTQKLFEGQVTEIQGQIDAALDKVKRVVKFVSLMKRRGESNRWTVQSCCNLCEQAKRDIDKAIIGLATLPTIV